MKRLFIGLPIESDKAANIVNDWKTKPINQTNKLVWTKPSNWHVTLVFLGATPESDISLLIPIMDEAFKFSRTLITQLKGVGVFPPNRKPTVLWIGLENIQLFNENYEKLVELLKENKFQFDQKPLKPHLTIARIKYLPDLTSFNEFIDEYVVINFGSVSIDRVILYESISTVNGVMYVPLYEKVFNSII